MSRPDGSFEQLLHSWRSRFGSQAVAPLLQIASSREKALQGTDDHYRYVALVGAAKLGGRDAAPMITPFLKDSSWMLRSAALKALTELRNPSTGKEVLPLLQDPALVVRLDAIEAVLQLRPEGSAEALIDMLQHGANYPGGKAQWVPQKALAALSTLHAAQLAPKLKPLLDHEGDPELLKQTIATLESLTGKSIKKDAPLHERVREWKLALKSD